MIFEYTYAKFVGKFDKVFKCFEICPNDHSWMNVSFQKTLDSGKHFSCQNNNRSCSIADFLILCPAEFDH